MKAFFLVIGMVILFSGFPTWNEDMIGVGGLITLLSALSFLKTSPKVLG